MPIQLRRPPPPAWALTEEWQAKQKDRAREKFMHWAVKKAASFREVPEDVIMDALKTDGGVPGPSVAAMVPEIPWHRAVFVNAPDVKSDRLQLTSFFSNGKDGKLELLSTRLWEEFTASSDLFALFKAGGIAGADGRLFCMYRSSDALCGVGHGRIVVPQKGQHLVAIQVVDFMKATL